MGRHQEQKGQKKGSTPRTERVTKRGDTKNRKGKKRGDTKKQKGQQNEATPNTGKKGGDTKNRKGNKKGRHQEQKGAATRTERGCHHSDDMVMMLFMIMALMRLS